MKTFLVYEAECPDEGSVEFTAHTEKGAMRAYRKATGEQCSRADLTPLEALEATPEIMAIRERGPSTEIPT